MAPPIPFTSLPGIIQFAISPFLATLLLELFYTCIAPRIVKSKWPPLIIPKDSLLEKIDDPGIIVIVSLPALIRSGSSYPGLGYPPTPIIPFSDYNSIMTSLGRNEGRSVGIPMPRLTYIPFFIS